MSGTMAALAARKLYELQDEIDAEHRHLQDLVFVRELLAAHGATPQELQECDAVIDGIRRELEESARRASDQLANAA